MSNQNRAMDSFRNLIHSKLKEHKIAQPLAGWNVDLCPIEMLIQKKLYSHQIAINRNMSGFHQFENGINAQLNNHQIAPSTCGWERLEQALLVANEPQDVETVHDWSFDQLRFHQLPTPEGAWERMAFSLALSQTSDDTLYTDAIQAKIYQHSLTVPEGAWASLASSMLLEAGSFEALICSKLASHTLAPPADAWNLLNTAVFASEMQAKLAQHQMAPHMATWNRVAATLSTTNHSKRIVFSVIAAAASLLLFVGIAYRLNNPSEIKLVASQIEEPKTQAFTQIAQQSADKTENKDTDDVKTELQTQSQQWQRTNKVSKSAQTKPVINNNVVNVAVTTVDTLNWPDHSAMAEVIITDPEGIKDSAKGSIDEYSLKVLNDLLADETSRLDKTNPSKQWLLTASVGTSQQSKQMESNFLGRPTTRLSSLSDTPIVDEDKISNASHQMPLSAGLSVRHNLSKKWAVESGLTYTYLRSSFDEGQSSRHIQQDLHYIGIPLSAVYYIVRQARWNLYSSVGGMVEKGLRNNTVTNKTMHSSHSINGLQWSLLANVGVSYQFYKGLSLYGAPHVSYYMENKDQPFSIRTDNRLNFQMQAGLRFEF